MKSNRYLVPFHPKDSAHLFTDVLIIGGGLAGLRAAIEIDPRQKVTIVTKGPLQQSNSSYAQGGIAGVLDSKDKFQWHVEDTMVAGGTLCDTEVVQRVVQQAPTRINELIDWGTQFDRKDGELYLGREGGHSHHRIVHALGDSTGREVMRAVIERVKSREHTEIIENGFVIDLLTDENQCLGAVVHFAGRNYLVWAKQTILCAGGAGQVFRETTNPPLATGDGQAISLRAGVRVRDMEFMQFHPTVLYIAGGGRCLITEAVRGEGAYLRDRNGHRFMLDYDERAELAPRDIVSQSIEQQIDKTHHTCVYLDLSHLDPELVRSRFPGMTKVCSEFNIDVTKDRIPVRPGAHYMIGGVVVDENAATSMERLWAAGEVTSSGLHGANRLASNSLLEGLVYGVIAGQQASEAAGKMSDQLQVPNLHSPREKEKTLPLDRADVANSLRSLMWRSVGVRRDAAGLQEANAQLERWGQYLWRHQFDSPNGWELQNLLQVSEAMIKAASLRTESRGVHYRTDYPEIDEVNWKAHVVFAGDDVLIEPAD